MNHYLSNMDEIKSLYIIVEGQTDARILHTLLNCTRYKKVYHIPAGGFANLSSMATTIRLMQAPKEAANKIVVAFDADSEKKDVINDRIATMRYLTGADYDNRIGVFCFVPTIEVALFPKGFPKKKGDVVELTEYIIKHIEELREMDIIKAIQAFIDEK